MKKTVKVIACFCMMIFGGILGWDWTTETPKEQKVSFASWVYVYNSVEKMAGEFWG